MKKLFLMAAVAMIAVACNDNNNDDNDNDKGVVNTYHMDATPTDGWEWTYVTLNNGVTTARRAGW